MTLDKACAEARLKAIKDFGPVRLPDEPNDFTMNQYNAKMQELFLFMQDAENEVRANWKEK